jgi:hypothetical protein
MNPTPKNGATGVIPEVVLSWDVPSGTTNPIFDVYLSAGDPNSPDPNALILVYTGPDKTFNPSPDLHFSRTYKWRVDIKGKAQGNVWTFTTKNPAGLSLRWRMNENSGTVVPDSAGSNHGTAFNAPSWVSGIDGNCLKFNDNGDYVSKLGANGLPLGGSNSWSVNMYLFLERPFAHWTVLGGFGLTNPGSGRGRFIMNMNDVITFWDSSPLMSNTAFDVGWWQMITVTYDGTTVRLYKNGAEILSAARILYDAEPEVWLSPLDIWGQGYVNGKIDEFTIWNDMLTQGEIVTLASIIPVKGDMDSDGNIDVDDLKTFAGKWLSVVSGECVGGSVAGDFNGDCAVNFADFAFIAEGWLK